MLFRGAGPARRGAGAQRVSAGPELGGPRPASATVVDCRGDAVKPLGRRAPDQARFQDRQGFRNAPRVRESLREIPGGPVPPGPETERCGVVRHGFPGPSPPDELVADLHVREPVRRVGLERRGKERQAVAKPAGVGSRGDGERGDHECAAGRDRRHGRSPDLRKNAPDTEDEGREEPDRRQVGVPVGDELISDADEAGHGGERHQVPGHARAYGQGNARVEREPGEKGQGGRADRHCPWTGHREGVKDRQPLGQERLRDVPGDGVQGDGDPLCQGARLERRERPSRALREDRDGGRRGGKDEEGELLRHEPREGSKTPLSRRHPAERPGVDEEEEHGEGHEHRFGQETREEDHGEPGPPNGGRAGRPRRVREEKHRGEEERKDVLSLFLATVLLLAYASWSARPTAVRRAGLAVIFLAGLLAKPMLVTLPVLLLLVDAWPLGRMPSGEGRLRAFARLVTEKLPLFVLSAAAAAVTILAQRSGGALASLETSPLAQRIAVSLNAVAWYVAKTFLPEGLSIFYPLAMPGPWAVAIGAATLALFAGLALHPRVPLAIRTGVTWYLVALAPVSGLIRVGDQLVADRYSYLPSIGLLTAFVFGVRSVLPKIGRPAMAAVAAGSTLVVSSFAVAAAADAGRFRDGLTLFSSALETDPANWLAHMKVGDELVRRGRTGEAVAHYAAALRLRPGWDGAAGNLAQALANTGRIPEALSVLEAGLVRSPSSEWLHRVAAAIHDRCGSRSRAAELRTRADALRSRSPAGGASPSKEHSLRPLRGDEGR